jgi:putative membrane protein
LDALFDKMQLTNLGQFHLIFSFILSILVAFRVNSSYARWWEGRTLWGGLVNNSRNIALKFNNYIGLKYDPLFNLCLQNFPTLFKYHLRRQRPECEKILTELGLKFKPTDHLPTIVINYMYQRINFYRNNGTISLEQYLVMDKHLANIVDVVGGCEKISNTPIPLPFKVFVQKALHFYMIVFPFGWAETFGILIIPIIIVFVYILSGMEILAEDMEDPFEENQGGHYNNLPLDTISENIRNNIKSIADFESDYAPTN